MLLLSAIFMAMTLGIFICYGAFANGVRTSLIHSPRLVKRIQKSFAIVFAVLGAKLAMAEQ